MNRTSIFKAICLIAALTSLQLCPRALVNPEPNTQNIFSVNTAEELNELTKTGTGNVVVDFHGEKWCPPCRMFAPVFAKVAASTPNVTFIKVDVDKFKPQGLRGVPTIKFYKDGVQCGDATGALSETQFRDLIKKTFSI